MAENIRIKEVRAYVSHADSKEQSAKQGADCHDVEDQHWINGGLRPIANPMSSYDLYKQYRKSWGINALGSVVVEVEAEDGTTGSGISIGGEPACFLIEKHLSRFVEGEKACNIERMWDEMFRGSLNYGRKGLALQAISAVDLALWDLWGHLTKQPVYALLGGKIKDRLPVYTTTGRPKEGKEMGFVGCKVPCPYGPADGDEGFRKNVEFFKQCREEVGPDFPLMLDCYMALTVPYTIKLAKALEPYGLKWIEEYLPPDCYDGYKQVREGLRGSSVLLTTGEHEYTRYGMTLLLQNKCVDIIQPDVTWVGGITEARRIVAMAAAHDVLCIPHGSSVYSYHLQYAFPNTPMCEFINLSPNADKISPYFGGLFPDEPLPKDGFIDLPEGKYGFGVTLKKEGLKRPYERSAELVKRQFDLNANAPKPTKAHMPF